MWYGRQNATLSGKSIWTRTYLTNTFWADHMTQKDISACLLLCQINLLISCDMYSRLLGIVFIKVSQISQIL